jgi:hypothetical protein
MLNYSSLDGYFEEEYLCHKQMNCDEWLSLGNRSLSRHMEKYVHLHG